MDSTQTNNVERLSWDDIHTLLNRFAQKVYRENLHFTGVYGIPRGGLVPAVIISHFLKIPLLLAPAEGCIVVDDIADSGRTLAHYTFNDTQKNKYFLFTLVKRERSSITPDYFGLVRDSSDWIVFPWEEL